jgi:hypothetical protein
MDHVVYLDAQAKELDNLLNGYKTMLIRWATGSCAALNKKSDLQNQLLIAQWPLIHWLTSNTFRTDRACSSFDFASALQFGSGALTQRITKDNGLFSIQNEL